MERWSGYLPGQLLNRKKTCLTRCPVTALEMS
jgi:hypothetical protein